MITEPDVTLTDYALAAECALLTCLLARSGAARGTVGPWFLLFFAATGLAAVTGGTVHGFFLDERTLGAAILWPATLLLIGVAALASWGIGAAIQFSPPRARWVLRAAALELAGYAAVVLFVSRAFTVAVVQYLPAALFLSVVFGLAYRRTGRRAFALGLWGLGLTFLATGVQQGGIALHSRYFTANAVQHVVQGVGLFLLFAAAHRLVGPDPAA